MSALGWADFVPLSHSVAPVMTVNQKVFPAPEFYAIIIHEARFHHQKKRGNNAIFILEISSIADKIRYIFQIQNLHAYKYREQIN